MMLVRKLQSVATRPTSSTNTDATHFASCRGTVVIEESMFRGLGDDATNVHGYYHDIEMGDDGWTRLVLHAPTYTHAQQADVPEPCATSRGCGLVEMP